MAIDVCLSAYGTPCWYSVLGLCLMGEARPFLLLCLAEGIMSGAPCFSGKSASSALPGTQLHPGDRVLLFGLWPGKEAGCTPSFVHAVTPRDPTCAAGPSWAALQGLHCRSEAEAGVNHQLWITTPYWPGTALAGAGSALAGPLIGRLQDLHFLPLDMMGDLSFSLCIAHSGLHPFGAEGSESLHIKVKVTEVGSVKLKAEMYVVLETNPKNNIKWPNCCFVDWQAITREDSAHNKL